MVLVKKNHPFAMSYPEKEGDVLSESNQNMMSYDSRIYTS